jgi:polysaccharide biosynthesis transport protein
LLVDADLRKGSLHNRFELESTPGFTESFTENVNWRETVQPTKFPNLWLLPRGNTTQHSSEFFLSPAMEKFLKEAGAEYEVVVLDTAPVMAADDVTSLAPLVDGVVFVVRAEHTSARVARAALEALYQRQVDVLGLVFNAVRPTSSDYYYYYKYKDYYTTHSGSSGHGHRHKHKHHSKPAEAAPESTTKAES